MVTYGGKFGYTIVIEIIGTKYNIVTKRGDSNEINKLNDEVHYLIQVIT